MVESQNGNPKAVLDHRAFTKDKKSKKKGKNWWHYECACKRSLKCRARITIDMDTYEVVKSYGIHLCPLKIGLYEALKAGNEKKAATKNGPPKDSAMKIVRDVNRKLSKDAKDLMPSLDNQRRMVSKRIADFYPKHPKPPLTLNELECK